MAGVLTVQSKTFHWHMPFLYAQRHFRISANILNGNFMYFVDFYWAIVSVLFIPPIHLRLKGPET